MESTHTPQRALIKLLAIVGFFALIALILWAIVQGLRAFPSAFSSLASIAETINTYRPASELAVNVEKNIVNSGETFTITWNEVGDGEYIFAYDCVDNVEFSVRTDQGDLRSIACTEDLILPSNVKGLFASITSAAQRFNDVNFSVAFDPVDGDVQVQEKRITVVNAEMPQPGTNVAVVPDKEATTTKPEPVPETPAPTKPAAPKPAPVVSTPTTITYFQPSLPNGTVDLKISFLGVGTIDHGNFVPKATFNEDDRAAFRFEVKNVGTKTAESWTYALTLPGDVDYRSKPQADLLPGERAIYTVGFDLIESRDRSVNLEAQVTARGDGNSRNDAFDWSVKVAR